MDHRWAVSLQQPTLLVQKPRGSLEASQLDSVEAVPELVGISKRP